MFSSQTRRPRRRRPVSGVEQALSWAVLAALAAMVGWLYWCGQQPGPVPPGGLTVAAPLAAPRPARGLASAPPAGPPLAAATAPAVAALTPPPPATAHAAMSPPDPTPAARAGATAASLAAPAAPPLDPAAGPLAGLAQPAWQAMGPVEYYDAEHLYEKIDGRAELYLAYQVQAMFCQAWSGPDSAAVELYAFDMGEPLLAFGVFAAERPADATPMPLGGSGYTAGGSCLFWQDRWYVQVLTAQEGPAAGLACRQWAARLSGRLGHGAATLWGLDLLPTAGRVAHSEQYVRRDALGLDFLRQAFTARYRLASGAELTGFVVRAASAAGADTVLQAYQAYLRDYGTQVRQKEIDGLPATLGAMSGSYDLVLRWGRFVGGVSLAADTAAAESVATALVRRLRQHDSGGGM